MTSLIPFLILIPVIAAQLGQQHSPFFSLAQNSRCSTFSSSFRSKAFTILDAIYYPAYAPVDLTNGQATVNTTALPAFCRLVLRIVTNPGNGKDAGAELWLPDEWNERLLGFGNGGWGGGDHTGSMWDGSFAGPGNDDAIIDFAWRALHMTTVVVKSLTTEFYYRPYTKSYFMGCSTGGRQGIKAMSIFPEDYDGLVLGSPANPFGQLMPWQARQGQLVHPVGSPPWIPEKTWNLIHAEAVKQCDMLDGVQDGIILDPLACDFHPETLQCQSNADASTCLTSERLSALRHLYAPYYVGPNNQTYVFSPFVPGGEYAYPQGLVGEKLFRMPEDYYRYFVLNDTTWQVSMLDEAVVAMGIDTNPGQMDVSKILLYQRRNHQLRNALLVRTQTYSPNLTAFFARGGKVLQYAGWDDELVSTGHSVSS
ncbi:hypothetical protein QFC24_006082 [Naganishia onofrii]|uniref:Uncharacterized protein n=1 Tax=Naganishia onofrii TaxID=1851511 RepID=A0ACC2X4E8_9TREE|nr:hypothetical protein QFC24_006082 [Naganishia onofrii]